ncbi:uncharacterized protein LOC100870283 isoform X3 [Apis florea]|uniref:uncharacterized protein LOC100870283 isoform X3 n=1 Tax=Apis florea TaxID=7463 RepID=UPI00062999D0|nr:uncharacterized protein LOC100870283 isoform X3 [Apis florea]XP_012346276.1 uncharacterized protein LOC100870283 isoform X3 [Apis florea]
MSSRGVTSLENDFFLCPRIPNFFIDPEDEGSESPVFGLEGGTGTGGTGTSLRLASHELPNEISAPYEVPQFPIEQIEKKLLIQRQLTVK